jgi:hypothetical protein
MADQVPSLRLTRESSLGFAASIPVREAPIHVLAVVIHCRSSLVTVGRKHGPHTPNRAVSTVQGHSQPVEYVLSMPNVLGIAIQSSAGP